MKSAFGMGLAVVVVTTGTCMLNFWLYRYLLLPLGESFNVPVESLKLIIFIVVIAGFVQLLEMAIERISLTLYFSLGIFLPLITVNCAILGASLFMVTNVTARSFGTLDVLVSLAEVAARNRYVRPRVTAGGGRISIRDGRHPVVEEMPDARLVNADSIPTNSNWSRDSTLTDESDGHCSTGSCTRKRCR